MKKEETSPSEEKTRKLNKEMIFLIIMIGIIVLVDQISKIGIQQIGQVNLIENILKLEVTQNTKPAYGIGSNSTIMYVLTNVVILGIIFKFMTTQNQFVDKKLKIFLSFILAGGISNVIDRVVRGYVTEFIQFTPMAHLPVFNIADVFVLIGWVAVAAIFASFTVKEWRSKKEEKVLQDEDKDKKE